MHSHACTGCFCQVITMDKAGQPAEPQPIVHSRSVSNEAAQTNHTYYTSQSLLETLDATAEPSLLHWQPHCSASCCCLLAAWRAPLPMVIVSRFSSKLSGKPVAINVTCTSPVYLQHHHHHTVTKWSELFEATAFLPSTLCEAAHTCRG